MALAALGLAAACRHASAPAAGGAVHGGAAGSSEVIVAAERYGDVPPLAVGQVLEIVPPDAGDWQVDFDETLLERITPAAKMRAPGAAGWRFRARAPGEGEIVLTSIVSVSGEQRPGPPMPARFVVPVKVKRQ